MKTELMRKKSLLDISGAKFERMDVKQEGHDATTIFALGFFLHDY